MNMNSTICFYYTMNSNRCHTNCRNLLNLEQLIELSVSGNSCTTWSLGSQTTEAMAGNFTRYSGTQTKTTNKSMYCETYTTAITRTTARSRTTATTQTTAPNYNSKRD